jgi:hypothetical protein
MLKTIDLRYVFAQPKDRSSLILTSQLLQGIVSKRKQLSVALMKSS